MSGLQPGMAAWLRRQSLNNTENGTPTCTARVLRDFGFAYAYTARGRTTLVVNEQTVANRRERREQGGGS